MTSYEYMMIAQIFYILQNVARVYFYTNVLNLKHDDIKHKIIILICISIFDNIVSYFSFTNFFLKAAADTIFVTLLFKVMMTDKTSKILLNIMISMNLMIVFELVVTAPFLILIGPDFFNSDSLIFNVLLQLYFTTVFFIIFIVAAHSMKNKNYQISIKLATLIVCITMLQSTVVLSFHYSIYSNMNTQQFVFTILSVLVSYTLYKIIIKRIYIEYKYKKNIAYFIDQYETCLNEYIELKNNDQEIAYLRHEILNQLATLEAYTRKPKE